MMAKSMPDSVLTVATLAWLPALIAVQSIPHTGALRTLLVTAGLLHLVLLLLCRRAATWPRGGREFAWLAGLTAWLVFHAALVSPTPKSALLALVAEWPKILLVAGIGIAFVARMVNLERGPAYIAVGLLLGYLVHVASTLAYQGWSLWRTGSLESGMSFLGNYGYASPFVAGALALLLAEVVIRLGGRRWLPMPGTVLALLLVATLAALGALASKATTVIAVVLVLAGAAAALGKIRPAWQIGYFAAGIVLIVAASLSTSNRWQGAAEAISTVIENPADATAIVASDPDAPVNRLDNSFFVRALSLKIGLRGVCEHPLGLGYGRDAFGRYVVAQGGPGGLISSESGWLDFALANGIPGLLLLLVLFFVIMQRGWRAFRAGNPAGLAAFLFVLNFALRSALDGHLTGSRLAGFAFVAAVLWAMSALPGKRPDAGGPD